MIKVAVKEEPDNTRERKTRRKLFFKVYQT